RGGIPLPARSVCAVSFHFLGRVLRRADRNAQAGCSVSVRGVTQRCPCRILSTRRTPPPCRRPEPPGQMKGQGEQIRLNQECCCGRGTTSSGSPTNTCPGRGAGNMPGRVCARLARREEHGCCPSEYIVCSAAVSSFRRSGPARFRLKALSALHPQGLPSFP